MKARVYTSAFGVSVTVPDASREVERDNGAIKGAAKVLANRLAGADDHDQAVRKAQTFCKTALNALSMPYIDQAEKQDSWRLLPTRNFEPLLEQLVVGNRAFAAAVEAMRRDAPAILELAKGNLSDLGNSIKFPTPDELVSSYKLGWTFEELPKGVVPGVPEYARAKLQRSIDAMLEVAADKAREHTLRKFVGPLESLVGGIKRLDEYEEEKRIYSAQAANSAGSGPALQRLACKPRESQENCASSPTRLQSETSPTCTRTCRRSTRPQRPRYRGAGPAN